jgi:hypothetical protein
MYKLIIFVIMIAITSLTHADSATQTDWSDGPGEIYPIEMWENAFKAGSGVDFSTPGILELATSIVSLEYNQVSDSFGTYGFPVSADFDGDGDIDLICDDFFLERFRLFENLDGVGSQWQMHDLFPIPAQPRRRTLPVDLDEDGDIDLLATCGPIFIYWENLDGSGLSWQEYKLGDYTAAMCIECDDFDQDGDLDILGCAHYGNIITSWENLDGIGHEWAEHVISSDVNYPRDLRICDIDGDSDTDFFCAIKWDETLCWFENLGSWSWAMHTISTELKDVMMCCPGDYDGDGDVDVASRSSTSSGAGVDLIWENLDGIGIDWLPHELPDLDGFMLYPLYSSDIDCDGDVDLFGSLEKPNTPGGLGILENVDALGWQWVYHKLFTLEAIEAEFTSFNDINMDGYVDFICAGGDEARIMWYDVIGPADTGWVESSILTVSDTDWQMIDWVTDEPAGTNIVFQVRSAWSWLELGNWSEVIESPGSLEGILGDGDRYVQYLATITREDPSLNPSLSDVTLTWNQLGLEDPEESDTWMYIANPSYGDVTICISIPNESPVSILIYDVSGHLVAESIHDSLNSGFNEIVISDLAPGIYLCKITAGKYCGIRRFTVIE